MYAWRNRNRRDHRTELTSGPDAWVPTELQRQENLDRDDEGVRIDLETKYVKGLVFDQRKSMYKYLSTDNGKEEVQKVIVELTKLQGGEEGLDDDDDDDNTGHQGQEEDGEEDYAGSPTNPRSSSAARASGGAAASTTTTSKKLLLQQQVQDLKKARRAESKREMERRAVREVFRRYDEHGLGYIDSAAISSLLEHFRLSLSDEDMAALLAHLDPNSSGRVEYPAFFKWFVRNAHKAKRRNLWSYIHQSGMDMVSNTLGKVLIEAEARNAIMDKISFDARKHGYVEFRLAKPPLFPCSRPHCYDCFLDDRSLQKHMKNDELHERLVNEYNETLLKFQAVDNAFKGVQGRKLMANRLIFSVDLADLAPRLKYVAPQPLRPRIADQGKRRDRLQRAGNFVLGSDPTVGIRPLHRTSNMAQQYLAEVNDNGELPADVPSLGSCIIDMKQCNDEDIDTAVVDEVGSRATIRFEWKTWTYEDTVLVAEFNGWRGDSMQADAVTGKHYEIKELSAGSYRYRYIVDGVVKIDPTATSKQFGGEMYNTLLVVNKPFTLPPKRPRDEPDIRRDGNGIPIPPDRPPERMVYIPGVNMSSEGKQLTNIILPNKRICDDGVWALFASARSNNRIMVIDLSFNEISDDGLRALAPALTKFNALKTLKLKGNGFSVDGVQFITHGLKGNNTIQILDLSSNRIGDDGAEKLALFIYNHCSIQSLLLDGNYIGDVGVTALAGALIHNRTLTELALGENKITPRGADALADALKCNGSLKILKLNANPLMSLGIMHIGEMLLINDSINELDLSNCYMVIDRDAQGYFAINMAIRKNRGIQKLALRNNGIDKINVRDLAFSMMKNNTILELDLKFNTIPGEWFRADSNMEAFLQPDLLSLTTCLDRNRALARDPTQGPRYRPKTRPMQPSFEGTWSRSRRWTGKASTLDKARIGGDPLGVAKAAAEREQKRIAEEEAWLRKKISKELIIFYSELQTSAGRRLVKCVGKVIAQFINQLDALADAQGEESGQKDAEWVRNCAAGIMAAILQLMGARLVKASKIRARSQAPSSSSKQAPPPGFKLDPIERNSSASATDAPALEADSIQVDIHENRSKRVKELLVFPRSFIPKLLEECCVPCSNDLLSILESDSAPKKRKQKVKAVEEDEDAQIAANGAVEYIDPETGRKRVRGAAAMQFRASEKASNDIPDPALVAENALLDTLADFNAFMTSLQSHIHAAIKSSPFSVTANRALSSLKSRSDLATFMLMYAQEFAIKRKYTDEYRSHPKLKPAFLCVECNERFASQDLLNKHWSKRAKSHMKFTKDMELWRSFEAVVRRGKYISTGKHFPVFYQLINPLLLPRDFCPQVFDHYGKEGRPIGVVEPDHVVRVDDIMGEWLQVAFAGKHAWMTSHVGPMSVMRVACDRLGFWDDFKPFHEPVYYNVSWDLPDSIELKVRHSPERDGKVFGALKHGMVVQCGGILNDTWLQIRYESVDASWVLLRNDIGVIFMEQVHEALQQRFRNTIHASPVTLQEDDLVYVEPEVPPDDTTYNSSAAMSDTSNNPRDNTNNTININGDDDMMTGLDDLDAMGLGDDASRGSTKA